MLLQCGAMVVKKLLVDYKITASIRQICLLGVICKVSNRKITFAIKFQFSALSNLLLYCELLIGPQPTFLECIVIFL